MDDVAAFAQAVRELAALSPDERAAMGRHNRQRVLNTFTHDRCIAQYDALYERLLTK